MRDDTLAAATSEPRVRPERRRRSHIRTFTGCLQCRQRHVKCDEGRPTCVNCSRMNLVCAAYPFRIDVRISTPKTLEAASREKKRIKTKQSINRTVSSLVDLEVPTPSYKDDRTSSNYTHTFQTMDHHEIKEEDDGDETIPGQLVLVPKQNSPEFLRSSSNSACGSSGLDLLEAPLMDRSRSDFSVAEDITLVPCSESAADAHFFSHFLVNVSEILIVYDKPCRADLYKVVFSTLAQHSRQLQDAMNALGALHLSNTTMGSSRRILGVMALVRYARAVRQLREKLASTIVSTSADLATAILLIFFEMMDSSSNGCHLHLRGAKEIVQKLFTMSRTAQIQTLSEFDRGIQTFLVSILGYLDVASCLCFAKSTLSDETCWEVIASSWQYSSGTPSLHKLLRGWQEDEKDGMEDIRTARSQLMILQAAAGRLASSVEEHKGVCQLIQKTWLSTLLDELRVWRGNLPDSFQQLQGHKADYFDSDFVESVQCLLSYEQAIMIYLHQFTGIVLGAADLSHCLGSIFSTFSRYRPGISQIRMLWPMFIAGTETIDARQQEFVRKSMQSMLGFGLNNISCALQILEAVWLRRRQGCSEVRWFVIQKQFPWALLLP